MLGQSHAAGALRVEQLEQSGLLGVIGAGRVAGRRPNTAILLTDQAVVVQLFGTVVPPVGLAHLLMQPLGAGLGQTVGQRLDHDGAVVVTLGFVLFGQFFGANAGAGDEAANVVGFAAVCRRYKVGQREVGLAVGLDGLLAQVVQLSQWFTLRVEQLYVVMRDLLGRPETKDRAGADQLLVDQSGQHAAGVGI